MRVTATLAVALHIRRLAVAFRGVGRAAGSVRLIAIAASEAARVAGRADRCGMFGEGTRTFALLLVDLYAR